ncbi:MAG: hypothetical protein M3Y71_03370 [Actinomycetota bacterium]|nr:hypothetical protein [Actinomycetota bacterium]
MRIDEAFRRVVGGYWWVIGLLVVLPAVGAASYGARQAPLYPAVARVQMSGGLAGTNVQADAATQLLLGVVTTPSLVEKAMSAAGISGDPVQFATTAITVTRVGVSAVNDVAVVTTSSDRSVIAVDSLVQQALSYSNVSHQSDANAALSLAKQIDAVTKDRDALISQLANASPGEVLTLQARIAAGAPTLADLLRQRSDLLLAAPSHASIGLLDPARPAAGPLPDRVPQLAALAGLAGLLVSLGIVAVAESLRPRIRGRRWIATELRCPSLGHLAKLDLTTRASAAVLRDFAASAALIMRRSRGQMLLLLPVDPRDEWLAARISWELEALTGLRVEHHIDALHPVADLDDVDIDHGSVVVVALSASVQPQRRLEELRERTNVLGWPMVGVLTFRWPGLLSRLLRPTAGHGAGAGTDAAAHASTAPATDRATTVKPSGPGALIATKARRTS